MMLKILEKVTFFHSEECLSEVENGHSGFPDRRREKVLLCVYMLLYAYILIYAYIHMHIHRICISKAIEGASFQFFFNLLLVNRKDMFRPCKFGAGRENLSSAFVVEIKPINACLKSLIILLELCVF